ncbi:DUF4306 domain-containing protein [Terribacillus sp. DMT04]|uniref:DUF4306 domain-containing protein n=1 Tax=Terribacillus sp. DMT04 TaxID=2850441 RepID=UPI001C2C5C03|nr:DUF4306 domain-containing protein [Terribacillus sp. DMT04]QXE02255.1 YjdJ family protein [Terribacillus sp. DMT04]
MGMRHAGFVAALCGFTVGFMFSLYEGSNLIEDSFEWSNSAPFTHLLAANPVFPQDILWIDFFVYAIKFYPVYPLLTLISAAVMLSITMQTFNRHKRLAINILQLLIGALILYMSAAYFSAHRFGSTVFRVSFLLIGIAFVFDAVRMMYKRNS